MSLIASEFIPKLFTTLNGYSRRQLAADLLAGGLVGVVAVPLALAFAIASGVSPDRGLVTAVVGGFIISALGGSRVQIGGPTGAFVVIVYGIVQAHGLNGLMICTFLAGAILIVMGLSGLGRMIKFIPYPVTTGFTSGIAVIIFSSQVKDFLGLNMGEVPADFLAKWKSYAGALTSVSWPTLGLSIFTLAVVIFWPKLTKRVPGPVVALVAAALLAQLLRLPVETIGDRFGELPSRLPLPRLPAWRWEDMGGYVRPATTIALLAAIESLLSAVVADGMIGGRHRANMELVAQGAANMASPLLGGIPCTGAIARTALNVRSGGRTPVAGIAHAASVLLVILFCGRWLARVPLCALSAILVMVSFHMSEWRSFKGLLKAQRSDVAVLLTTFFLTVLFDLTLAVEVGMVLAAFLFMRRMAEVTEIGAVTGDEIGADEDTLPADRRLPADVQIYDINGPFFFGAADKLGHTLAQIQKPPKVFILRLSNVPVMDATGLRALMEFHARCQRLGTAVLLCGIRPQPMQAMEKAGAVGTWGRDNFHATDVSALKAAKKILEDARR